MHHLLPNAFIRIASAAKMGAHWEGLGAASITECVQHDRRKKIKRSQAARQRTRMAVPASNGPQRTRGHVAHRQKRPVPSG